MPKFIHAAALLLCAALTVNVALAAGAIPGERIAVKPADLPAPYATPSTANPPRAVKAPENAALQAPPGFRVSLFAEGLKDARWLAVAPSGDVFLAESSAGRVTLLRDSDGDGKADVVTVFASGFDDPHGLAVRPGYLYVADTDAVWRLKYEPGQTKASGKPEQVTPDGAFGGGGGHWTRNIAFSADGARFYVAIGSRGNIGEEPLPRASVQEFAADGEPLGTFASGLRNPVGISFYPGTSDLYVVVNERDGMGDGLVPDYLTRLAPGGFYGWPYYYIGANPQPRLADKKPQLAAEVIVPDLLFRSHSAPLGLVFYDAEQFPEDYRGDAFVALHGSWNAAGPRGYVVARVPFEDGRPQGYYEAFLTGFWAAGEKRPEVWGRPVGLAVARDGSLLVADDVGQKIWRVSNAPQ